MADAILQDEVFPETSLNSDGLQITTNTLLNCDDSNVPTEIPSLNKNSSINTEAVTILTPHQDQELLSTKVDVSQSSLEMPSGSVQNENYKIGDIVWAKIGRYPFWPSIVCMDPKSDTYLRQTKQKNKCFLHVRFCNDKGRRSWTKMIEKYCGKHELILKYPNCLAYIKNFKKLMDTWNLAVVEADNLLKLDNEVRMAEFFQTFFNNADTSDDSSLPLLKNSSEGNATASKIRTYSRKRSLTIPEEDSKIKKTENNSVNGSSSSRSIDIPLSRSDDVDSTVSDISMGFVDMEVLNSKSKQENIKNKKSTKTYPPKSSLADKYDLSDSMGTPSECNDDDNSLPDNHNKFTVSNTASITSTSIKTLPKQKTIELSTIGDGEENSVTSSLHSCRSSKKNMFPKSTKSDQGSSSNNSDQSSNILTLHSQRSSSTKNMASKKRFIGKQSLPTSKSTTVKSESSPEPDTTESEASSKNETYTSIFLASKKNKQLFAKNGKRACVVCKNSEVTQKCRGPCQSFFHKECFAKSEEIYRISEPIIKIKKMSGRGHSKRNSLKFTHNSDESIASVSQVINNINEENIEKLDENTISKSTDEGESVANVPLTINNINEEITNKLDVNVENLVSESINSMESLSNEQCSGHISEETISHELSVHESKESENRDHVLIENVNNQGLSELDSATEEPVRETSEEKTVDITLKSITIPSNDEKVSKDDSKLMCSICKANRTYCFICGLLIEDFGQKIVCKIPSCGKYYHEKCLEDWPQCQWIQGLRNNLRCVVCPRHVCHLCISDNPKSFCKTHFPAEKLTRCIKCPTAYHRSEYCLPAGSQTLTLWDIICSRHYVPTKMKNYHFNATWCFICTLGGELVCCDLCPSSFHVDCLKQNASEFENGFTCEECQTGRYPLYGEIVWVKIGRYRWWPAQIIFPSQVPDTLNAIPHSVGQFAVRFFGSYDYYWVNRGRVFNFHEGDDENILVKHKMKVIDQLYQDAIIEAAQAHNAYIIDKDLNDATVAKKSSTKPPKFIRIKFNKPFGNIKNELDNTNMNPCECDPNKPNPCGPGSDCINRMLMFECHPNLCPAGEKCNNQRFEKTLYPAMEPFLTKGRGWGLRTLEDIKEGSFVIEYVGDVIDEEEFQRRCFEMNKRNEQNYYFLTIDNSRMIDAGPKGNLSRFMNHSCEPNCVTQKWTVNGDTRIGLFALHDIPSGTELVFDYRLQSCSGVEKKPCQCGAARCSRFIGVKVEEEKKKVMPMSDTDKCKASTKNKRKPLKLKDNVSDSDKSKLSKLNNIHNISTIVNGIDASNAEKVNYKKSKIKSSISRQSTDLKNENSESSETHAAQNKKMTISSRDISNVTKNDDTVNSSEMEETVKPKRKLKNILPMLSPRKYLIKDRSSDTDNSIIVTKKKQCKNFTKKNVKINNLLPLPKKSTKLSVALAQTLTADNLSEEGCASGLDNIEGMKTTSEPVNDIMKTEQIPEVFENASMIKIDNSIDTQKTSRHSLTRLAKSRHLFLSKNDTNKKTNEQQHVVPKIFNKVNKNITKIVKTKRGENASLKNVVLKKKKINALTLLSKSYNKNDSCLICGKGHTELTCKNKKCPRVFHLSCMNKARLVKSGFICPSHFCSVCKKRKVVAKCKFCVESFCTTHVKGNIFKDPLGNGMLCTTHHPNKKTIAIDNSSATPNISVKSEINVTIKVDDPVDIADSSISIVIPEVLSEEDQLDIATDEINEEEYILTQVIKDESDREYIHIGGFNVCNMTDLVTEQGESYTAPIDTDGDLFKPSSANVVIDIESASALYHPTESLQLVSIATENKDSHDYANVHFIPDSANQIKNKWLAAEL